MSERTKKLRNKSLTFGILSKTTWFLVGLFNAIMVFIKASNGEIVFNDHNVRIVLVGSGITISIALILAIFIATKLRTTVYMISVMISTFCLGYAVMVIIFLIWFVDEYIFHSLANYFSDLYRTNKEIDNRIEK